MRRLCVASISIVSLLGCPRPEPPSAPTTQSATTNTRTDAPSAEAGWIAPSDMTTRPTSMEGFPKPVSEHTAVWTGEVVLFWGGNEAFAKEDDGYRPVEPIGRADGGIYDPATDQWRPLPSAPLAGRLHHVAAWTGREMLVFGGRDATAAFADGAAFDPTTSTWRKLAIKGGPSSRASPGAAWTGRELVVIAGSDAKGRALDDAFAYDPAKDTWRPLGTLSPRDTPTAVWTGSEIVVWGGIGSSGRRGGPVGTIAAGGDLGWHAAGGVGWPRSRRLVRERRRPLGPHGRHMVPNEHYQCAPTLGAGRRVHR
jgi:Kelch motif